MKIALKVATVLTRFNLIFWGFMVCFFLLGFLAVGYLPGVMILVLLSAIPLNCYAALSSIRASGILRYP